MFTVLSIPTRTKIIIKGIEDSRFKLLKIQALQRNVKSFDKKLRELIRVTVKMESCFDSFCQSLGLAGAKGKKSEEKQGALGVRSV